MTKKKNIFRRIINKSLEVLDDTNQMIKSFFIIRNWNKATVEQLPIKVAFIVQMAEIWDKEEPVFEYMKSDSRFDVTMIVVPPYDIVSQSITDDYSDNYFLTKYKNHAIKAFQDGKWIDVKGKYHYVFYQRPYDSYLPEQLRSRYVSEYAKCCYVPYGFSASVNFKKENTDRRFFENIYFCFCETEYRVKLLNQTFPLSKNFHHFECLGYPSLIPYFAIKSNRIYKSVLWTPRWSFDKRIGGSTFIENKDILLKLAENKSIKSLIFRPHPLLFSELISKKMMSKAEIDSYLAEMNSAGITYDFGTPIIKAFEDADILITDISSMIIEFYMTGKPVIYCDAGLKLNDHYEEISKGFYIAHSQEEVVEYVLMLLNGNDYKYDLRQEIIKKYSDLHISSTKRIVDRIIEDSKVDS